MIHVQQIGIDQQQIGIDYFQGTRCCQSNENLVFSGRKPCELELYLCTVTVTKLDMLEGCQYASLKIVVLRARQEAMRNKNVQPEIFIGLVFENTFHVCLLVVKTNGNQEKRESLS